MTAMMSQRRALAPQQRGYEASFWGGAILSDVAADTAGV